MTLSFSLFRLLRRYSASIIWFTAAMSITLFTLAVVHSVQQRYTGAIFDSLANRQAIALEAALTNDLNYIGTASYFMEAIDHDHWGEFGLFAEQLVKNSKSLIGVQWMAKVEADELEAHTERVRLEHPSFTPFTVPKDEPKQFGYILENNKPVYILSDIFPRDENNLSLLGFYSSRLRFDLILDDITQNARPNVSDKVRLLQDGYDQALEKRGLLIYHPVFAEQRNELMGVMIGVVRSTIYFDELVKKTATELELEIRVTDTGFDASDDPILFQTPGWGKRDLRELVWGEQKVLTTSKTVHLPNRDWLIEYQLNDSVSVWDETILKTTGTIGLIISCLIAYIVNFHAREKERLSEMLDEKTVELKLAAESDVLTKLRNRRSFNEHLDRYIKDGVKFSLIGFDIDFFKPINDDHGHLAGDEMLIHISRLVTHGIERKDRLFRVGGDEFCILARSQDREKLMKRFDAICQKVDSTPLTINSTQISCSLSMGIAVHEGEDAEALYHKMDSALYKSKENGRNQVSIA